MIRPMSQRVPSARFRLSTLKLAYLKYANSDKLAPMPSTSQPRERRRERSAEIRMLTTKFTPIDAISSSVYCGIQ